jgi:hypothetical protein
MTDAIADWEAELQKPEDKRMSLHLFAEVHNIPYTTLQTHITTNDSKRIKLGSGVGAKRNRPLDDSYHCGRAHPQRPRKPRRWRG